VGGRVAAVGVSTGPAYVQTRAWIMITKLSCTYTMRNLHDKKCFRDHDARQEAEKAGVTIAPIVNYPISWVI
jgi:hypothetical protein